MTAKRISFVLFCYFLFFRLYAICSLFYSFIIQNPSEKLIRNTNDGYQLTIFQLEFYFFLIVLYGFRPSRFNKTILKSYSADGSKNFSKKIFFWIVYVSLLLVVFGIPLLILNKSLLGIFEVITDANQYILENTILIIMAAIFLGLNILRLDYDFINAVDQAKIRFFRFLLVFMLTIPASVFLYLISFVLNLKADTLTVISLAFNLSFLYVSISDLTKRKKDKTK